MFILSECYVKKNKLQVQTEATIESEVSESEALVIEGMDYIAERGLKLDITYPILQKDNIEGIFIGTYMVNPVKLGNGLGEKGEGAYIVVNIIDWPSLYKDTNIKSLDFTAYNASCIFDDYDINENKYAKKQMKIKGESKTVYGNDEDKLKLIILNEFPMSDQISHNYMQPGDIEIQRAIDDITSLRIKPNPDCHDRLIVLNYGEETELVYHCGASSKDAGKKLCAINQITETAIIHPV